MRVKKFYGMFFAALLVCGSFQVMGESANKDTFKTEVLESKMPVMVMFDAEWCGPCRQVLPLIKELEKDYSGKVTFREVNTDEMENGEITQKYGVSSLPTFMLFKDGQRVGIPKKNKEFLLVGAQKKEKLKEWIDSVLKK